MIEINLLPVELKVKVKKTIDAKLVPANRFLYIIYLLFGLLICAHIYLLIVNISSGLRLSSLVEKWEKLSPDWKRTQEYKKENEALSTDIKISRQLASQRVNYALKLNKISLFLPPGVWIEELVLNQKDLNVRGSTVSLAADEMTSINKFIEGLKNDAEFSRDFSSLELGAMQRKTVGSYDIVDFVLKGTVKSY